MRITGALAMRPLRNPEWALAASCSGGSSGQSGSGTSTQWTGPDGLTHIAYEDGDEEDLVMRKEKYEVVPAAEQVARAFMAFCEEEKREWLPATGATVRLHIAHLLAKGTVQAASMQPYLSAINSSHEDMGFTGPAKGQAVSRAVKGMSYPQVQVADTAAPGSELQGAGQLQEAAVGAGEAPVGAS
ncbi:hypothetical protein CYMTET_32899 [Cymbomonas tetramitiformis]|uniref:Uncharacterized protein n=1 Tax=Cymbomonas tetramitiformis TaxID=36881 RepID=A0AAE0FDX1_9CHLO|nr:hypothetical protein CYMTET_32899 [Cymbomonas tetramitiformis]